MNIKIKVTDENISLKAQEACFNANIFYSSSKDKTGVIHGAKYLYVTDKLMYGLDDAVYAKEDAIEMNPEDFINKLNVGELKWVSLLK